MLMLIYKDKAKRLIKLTIKEREEFLNTSLRFKIILNNVIISLSENVKES
jgi:hypothetical protein